MAMHERADDRPSTPLADSSSAQPSPFADDGAAAAAEPSNPRTHTLALRDVWRLRGMLTVGVLEACVNAVLGHIYLPYARTIQRCAVAPTAAQLADVHSREWSGSLYCADRDEVARDAQSVVNIAQGVTLGLCCLVLPTYGVLADRWGRWRVIAVYFGGIALLCVANALSPSQPVFVLTRSLSGLLGDPHPIAHAQIADVCAPEVRSSCFAFVLVVKMAVGAIAGLVANVAIVGRHTYSYTPVWLGLGAGCVLLVIATFCFDETHPRYARRRAALRRGEPPPAEPAAAAHAGLGLAEAWRVVSQPVLRHVIVVASLCIAGLSSFSVVAGWLIIVYGWPQERFGYISLALLPVVIGAMASAPALQRRLGIGRYLAGATALMLLSLCCLDLAFLHPALFVLSMALLSAAFSSAPAFMAATTLIVSEDDQGKTQGAMSATFHGVSALSLSLYGALFRAQALLPGRVVSLCFWVGTAFVALGAAHGYATRTWHELGEAGRLANERARKLDPDGELLADEARVVTDADLAEVQLRELKLRSLSNSSVVALAKPASHAELC
jgi:MFS family permease